MGIGMIGAEVLLGAEGTTARHLYDAVGTGQQANLTRRDHAAAHLNGGMFSAHMVGAQNGLAAQVANVTLGLDRAAAAHVHDAVAVVQDHASHIVTIDAVELAQGLNAHQKVDAAAAHCRNAALKIGDAAHVRELVQHELDVAGQATVGVGIGLALGHVKRLLNGNARQPRVG